MLTFGANHFPSVSVHLEWDRQVRPTTRLVHLRVEILPTHYASARYTLSQAGSRKPRAALEGSTNPCPLNGMALAMTIPGGGSLLPSLVAAGSRVNEAK
jgi:hypothetical protein